MNLPDLLAFWPILPGLWLAWRAWRDERTPKPPTVFLRGTPDGPVSTDEVVESKNYPN